MTLSDYLSTLILVAMFTVGYATIYTEIETTITSHFEKLRSLNTWLQHIPQTTFVLLTLISLRIINMSMNGAFYWVFINMEAVIIIFSNLIADDLVDFILIQAVGLYTFALTGAITWVTGPIYILASVVVYSERWYGPIIGRSSALYYLPPVLLGGLFWLAIGIEYHDTVPTSMAVTNYIGFILACMALISFDRFQHRDQQIITRLQHEVRYDGLTQIRNWGMFQQDLSRTFNQRQQTKGLALIALDIDHFKSINDTYGHLIGNQALVLVATRLNHELGKLNEHYHVYRTGGEEFAIILPGASEKAATLVAARCAAMIQGLNVHIRDGELHLTASFGVALDTDRDPNATHLYKRADTYLYQSKDAGRNQVSVEGKLLFKTNA